MGDIAGAKNSALVAGFSGGATVAAGIWAIIKSVIIMIKDIKQIINEIKNENNTNNIINLYRTKLLRYCVNLQKSIIKFENKISKIN